MKTLCSLALLLFAFALLSCGKDDDNNKPGYGSVYIRMSINGSAVLNATAESPTDQSATVSARITTQDLEGPEATVPKNTLIIGGTVIIDQASAKVKTLNISMPNVIAPGTYDLIEKGGMFIYSDASEGMSNLKGYTIMDAEDGSCSITITKVGGEPIPTAGKVVKGTFTATVKDGGVTYTLTGAFNGGLKE